MNKITVIGETITEEGDYAFTKDHIVLTKDATIVLQLDHVHRSFTFTIEEASSLSLKILSNDSDYQLSYFLAPGCNLKVDHFSKEDEVKVELHLGESATTHYFFRTMAKAKHTFHERILHEGSHSESDCQNHGVNLKDEALTFIVDGVVPKNSIDCICNQDNKIIERGCGKSTILPNLLIDEYQVEANHAAYIGMFDDESLFYLATRGISKEKALKLLLAGFFLGEENDQSIEEYYLDYLE